ncbi:putative ABC transporter permease subunit [Massilia sp.]|uniref:putative ABC transporter permease subunit n=1 Tax=Massilia sp. TaxID=1882437 RepID=UPI00391E0208
MSAAPGSIPWLFRHELRLWWFSAGSAKSEKSQRRPGLAGLALIGLAWLALHAIAFFVVSRTAGIDPRDPQVLVAVSALLYGSMTFMLSSALKSSVLVLFERGDLDLLLSSPLPSHSIFTVRLATVAAGTAALYLFFLAPFAHAGALLGHVGWLAVYPVLLGAATVVACAAMLLTLGLVRLIGAQRTRVVAQVIGALAGALIFILSQLFAHLSRSMETRAAAAFARAFAEDGGLGAGSPVWLPGRALLGEPLPVLGVVAVAAAAFLFTAARTHRFFVHGLQQAASSSRAARRPAGGLRLRFGRGLFMTMLLKEWRLILRDPQLISHVALQLIYLLPLFFIIFKRSELQLPALAAGLTLLCSSLTASLAWIIVSAEDAPDLLRLSPAPQGTVRNAKLAAAVSPCLFLVLAPVTWLIVRAPLAGLGAAGAVLGAVCAAALIVHWCGRPGLRSDYVARGKGDFLSAILGMFNSLSWGALAWFLASIATGPSDRSIVGASFAALSALATLGVSWLFRRPRP